MTKWMSRYWAVPAVAGLALVMVAALLSSSTPGSPGVPAVYAQETDTPTPTATNTPTATATPVCDLRITKTADDDTVPEGGTATYTITVRNRGSSSCTPDIEVSDTIPADTDCSDASVDSSSDIDEDNVDISGCKSTGTVTWATSSNLAAGDYLILDLALKLTSGAQEDDEITNRACIEEPANLGCDEETITVGEPATATPQPTATAQPTVSIPTVIAPPPPPPVIAPLPTLSPPVTGTGTDGGSGSGPLVIGLGLAGACLLLVSGVALVKRTR